MDLKRLSGAITRWGDTSNGWEASPKNGRVDVSHSGGIVNRRVWFDGSYEKFISPHEMPALPPDLIKTGIPFPNPHPHPPSEYEENCPLYADSARLFAARQLSAGDQ
jgi:hypothetical protein